MRKKPCYCLDDLHTGLGHFSRLFFHFILGPVGRCGGNRESCCWLFCFMSFHHWESVSEWQGKPAWPSLCWRYSAISAGNLSDSSPSSSSTWLLGALSSCTLASLGTAALEPERAGTLWWLQRWAAGRHCQMLEGSASWVECLRRPAGQDGGLALHGWKKPDRRTRRMCAEGETIPTTGTVHLKDAMPKTWTMEEVGETKTTYLFILMLFHVAKLKKTTARQWKTEFYFIVHCGCVLSPHKKSVKKTIILCVIRIY